MSAIISHITQLEKCSDDERFNYIIAQLEQMKLHFKLHRYESGCNIIVPATQKPYIIVSSHFDTFLGISGANDNASAIAVCLELLRKKAQSKEDIDFQVIFFDEEEVGLRGSKAYIKQYGIQDCVGLLNMELVGMGDRFALWPLSRSVEGKLLANFEAVAKQMNIACFRIDKIVTNSADHLSFRNAGLRDAFTITCIGQTDLEVAAHYRQAVELEVSHKVLFEIMQKAPVFQHYHQPSDTSEKLSETALQMTLDAIWNTLAQ